MTAPVTTATSRWASTHSRLPDTDAAAAQAADLLAATLGEGAVDLALVFFTSHHVARADELRGALQARLAAGCLAGASGAGVITAAEELEEGPGLSVIAARLPGVQVRPFLLTADPWNPGVDESLEFARLAPGAAGAELALLLGDPFTLDMESVLRAFNRHVPKVRAVGGMASAGHQPGSNALFLNDWCAAEGGVAVTLHGAVRADVVVSQGCRAVGPPLEVTRCDRNVILALDGTPASERIQAVFDSLEPAEQALVKHGLLLGRPVRPGAAGRGDYLVRNLLGHDPKTGAVAVGDVLLEHERVRLHVRDAETAREDLEMLLSPQAFDSAAQAVMVFSCNGRGRNLHPHPDGDIRVVREALGGVPAAGFFCAGEIGPVGERNFLHGHTASLAILRGK